MYELFHIYFTSEKLKLVNRVDTVSSDDYKTKMANKHPKLFTGLGQMKDSYTMFDITTNSAPQNICNLFTLT